MYQSKVSVKYSKENSVFGEVSYEYLFNFGGGVRENGVGVGAYSRWALIQGWALIRINTVQQPSKVYANVCELRIF